MVATATLDDKLAAARTASIALAQASTAQKNAGLEAIAKAVEAGADRILPANELDLANGRENDMSQGLQDRLRLDATRLAGLAAAAFCAISRRSSGLSFAARAFPPTSPPRRPSATAAGSRVSSGSGLRSLVASSTMDFASWLRSSFLFRNARCVNSPGRARRAPASTKASSMRCWM